MFLHVIDLNPRIGSEIRTDLQTLLDGREAETIRDVLERRGVVFFRGLSISDEQQVAFARTLGSTVQSEGEDGIYKVSLDRKVNARADYLKGSMFWHFDGSLHPYPNYAALLRAVKLSDTGGQTEFCNTYAAYDDLPDADKQAIAELRVMHSAERSQYYVTPEMSYEEIQFWQRTPGKECPLVWTHRSGASPCCSVPRRITSSACRPSRAEHCWHGCVTGPRSLSMSTTTHGSRAIC